MTILDKREERIKIFLNKGYTTDLENGIIYNTLGNECKCISNEGYIILHTTYNKKKISLLAHQLIYYISTGEVVEQIDHINGVRFDNKIKNLRKVTHQQNQHNRTKAKGYYWHKKNNKWMAYIKVDGKNIHLKYWNTELEAHQAYKEAKKKYHIL